MAATALHNELRRRAIAYLARREHSRAELVRKLLGAPVPEGEGVPAEAVERVLDELAAQGLQSDRRFAESWLRAKARRFGTARLRHDLQARGVAAEIIDAALAESFTEAREGDEHARVRAVWQSRFGHPPADVREEAKQARFLQGRGFSVGAIRSLLKEVAHS